MMSIDPIFFNTLVREMQDSVKGEDKMEKIEYPEAFLDYLIDNVVIPYIEKESSKPDQPCCGNNQASD